MSGRGKEHDAAAFSPAEKTAMRRALAIARTPGVPLGPNPRVGCVLLDHDGVEVAEGFHRGAGTPHAEVEALRTVDGRTDGLTAVVTLEPCNHTGRTGPCAQALLDAGIVRVVYAQEDPNPVAAGGSRTLTDAGVEVAAGLLRDEARSVNRAWTFAVEHDRPFVTWKFAASLDGRSAAIDGTSRWVSNQDARRDTHRLRGECDVVLAGTGTVLSDDPQLTVRDETDHPLPVGSQPLRAVMGLRDVPAGSRVLDDHAQTVLLRTRDPRAALDELYALGRRHVFLEGGPRLAAAFLEAGVVDEVVAYVAPMLLGGGVHAVEGLSVGTIAEALRLAVVDVTVLGTGDDRNVRLTMQPTATQPTRVQHVVDRPRKEH
jgi:diaminohydroxyphosphoribosylaminopyrimidine deaminase/5-amino-6-(5-phosphoribosylamino)uracil reductase